MSEESIALVEDKGQPVKYTVLEKSLVGNEIFEAGSTCEYAGLPAENLAPQCDIGKARFQEYKASNAERVASLKAQFADDSGALGEDFSKRVAAAIAEANAAAAAGLDDRIAKAVATAMATAFPNGTAKPAAKLDASVPPIA